jgi:hypothetical protein
MDQFGNVYHASTHVTVVPISTQLNVEHVDLELLTELHHTITDGGIIITGVLVKLDGMKLAKYVYNVFFLV